MKRYFQKIVPAFVLGGLLLPVNTLYGQVSSVFVRNYPQSYIVQDGDTINRIAGQFLTDPSAWSDFWLSTPYRESDSDIRPGDVIRVEFINGRARLVAQRGDLRLERLAPQMREIGVTSEIPEIPLEDIQSSFSSNRIVPQDAYDNAPYIISPVKRNLVIGTGDEIYARGDWPAGASFFEIYRQVNSYSDPESRRELSVELVTVGSATIVGEESRDIKRLLVNSSKEEIKAGDHLLLREELPLDSVIYPTEPDRQIQGRVISMTNTERMASQLDSVLIDVGSRDGLASGHVLSIKQTGDQIVDETDRERKSLVRRLFSIAADEKVEMPRHEVGTLLVYRVFDNLSYGVILSSNEPARIGDMVVNP
jgi:hypothetical protein